MKLIIPGHVEVTCDLVAVPLEDPQASLVGFPAGSLQVAAVRVRFGGRTFHGLPGGEFIDVDTGEVVELECAGDEADLEA